MEIEYFLGIFLVECGLDMHSKRAVAETEEESAAIDDADEGNKCRFF